MQMTPYLLNSAFLANIHIIKHLTCHANVVGTYHYSLLCPHQMLDLCADGQTDGQIDGWTNEQTKYHKPVVHALRVKNIFYATLIPHFVTAMQ